MNKKLPIIDSPEAEGFDLPQHLYDKVMQAFHKGDVRCRHKIEGRVMKSNSCPEDIMRDGHKGTVKGSLYNESTKLEDHLREGYLVLFDGHREAVVITGNRLAVAL